MKAPQLTAACLMVAAALCARPPVPGPQATWEGRTHEIYERLKMAQGPLPHGRSYPPLRILPDPRPATSADIARLDLARQEIQLGRRAIRTCFVIFGDRGFGDRGPDCIAFLLGHELMHFVLNHGSLVEFQGRYPDLMSEDELVRVTTDPLRILYDQQADEGGAIVGQLAGFRTLDIAPRALTALVEAYDGGTPRGTAVLAERQAILRKAAASVRQSLPLFEAGHLLFFTGHYEAAAASFSRLAQRYPSRELLNNAGVAWAAASAFEGGDPVRTLSYPWMLDAQTRLRPPASVARGSGGTRERELLLLARAALEEALRRDPAYAPAMVNLAGVLDLLGRSHTAHDLLGDVPAIGPPVEPAARVLGGIVQWHLGRRAAAQEMLTGVPEGPWAALGKRWFAHLSRGTSLRPPDEAAAADRGRSAQDACPDVFVRLPEPHTLPYVLGKNGAPGPVVVRARRQDKRLFLHLSGWSPERERFTLRAVVSQDGACGTGSVGQPLAHWQRALPALREARPAGLGGAWWIDEGAGLLLRVAAEGRVVEWMRWQVE